jgi:hypothetical protein
VSDWQDRAESLGISYRQLDWWTRCGYLRPVQRMTNRMGNGTGYQRQWPECELAIAAAMGRLVRLGLTPEAAHKVARAGRESWVTYALADE